MGSKNLLYKLITSIQGRAHNKTLVALAGPAHLAGKPNGVLAAAIMAQMELNYMQHVAVSDENKIRCILTTDAEAAFQFANRRHCYEVLCSEATLKERFAPLLCSHPQGCAASFLGGKPATQTIFGVHSGRCQLF